MKWILIMVLISVIMLIAYAVSEQYKEKFDFYDNLKNFFNQFKMNLNFRQDKILNFLNQINSKKQFKLFISSYKQYLKTNELDLSNIKILNEDEINQLSDMVKNIGKFDSTNEIKQIETFMLDIDDKVKKAEKDKEKLCPMIIKLSLLFAVALAILLI